MCILIILVIVLFIYVIKINNNISSMSFKQNDLINIIDSSNKQIEILKNELLQKDKQIELLKEDVKKLKQSVTNITSIKFDSLNLNVSEDEDLIEKNENIKIEVQEELSIEQNDLFKKINQTNENMFITGKAGTGKSYLLKYFKKYTLKKVLYAAPTGIAALNIEGVTLHSAFGWNNLMEDNEIILSKNKIELLKNLDTLIIDEVSMVRVDVFNQVDKILRKANNNDLPFGGKQVVLFGDLFQLPPVAKKEECEYFSDKYGGIFFFNSPAYELGKFKFYELKEIFRQTDKHFKSILNNIRVGNINKDDIKSLNEHIVEEVPRRVVQIVPKKEEANKINTDNLNKLDTQEYEYHANILVGEDKIKENDFPCDFDLRLKVGSLIMMITNDQEHKRWVNGTLGIVSKLSPTMIKVTINGTEFEISPVPFNKYKCEYDREESKLKYKVEASVSQFPIILAYAITIHKSQGMTYQQIACNLDSCFAPGQAYVALSRCANYDKLYLTNRVNPGSIITDNVVTNFYNAVNKGDK